MIMDTTRIEHCVKCATNVEHILESVQSIFYGHVCVWVCPQGHVIMQWHKENPTNGS